MPRAVLLLGLAACAAAAAPVFDYTFGANCPFCKEFGPTLTQLYGADGIADAVDFRFHAAIRAGREGLIGQLLGRLGRQSYECPDEKPNCPMTMLVLCALDQANATKTKVAFMGCWDDKQDAQACAKAAGLDYSEISSCSSGEKGKELQKAAVEDFKQRFPSHAGPGGIFGVPNIQIDEEEQQSREEKALLEALCAKGISAGACKKTVVV